MQKMDTCHVLQNCYGTLIPKFHFEMFIFLLGLRMPQKNGTLNRNLPIFGIKLLKIHLIGSNESIFENRKKW